MQPREIKRYVASLRNDKQSRGEESGEGLRGRGGGVRDASRARVHLGVGGTGGEEGGGEGSFEAGTAHVTQGDDARVGVQRGLEPET